MYKSAVEWRGYKLTKKSETTNNFIPISYKHETKQKQKKYNQPHWNGI